MKLAFLYLKVFLQIFIILCLKRKKKNNTSTIFHFATMKNATTLKKYNIC